jgi:hypothetical protein
MTEQKRIGPTFGFELEAAGLLGLPFLWTADGEINFTDQVSQHERDAVMAVYGAHAPSKLFVPQQATRYQARAALLAADLLQQVNDHFAALPDDDMGKLAWQEAPTVERSSPALIDAAHALGLSDEMIDQLFIAAASVQ